MLSTTLMVCDVVVVRPPQPSDAWPQLAPSAAHVVGAHEQVTRTLSTAALPTVPVPFATVHVSEVGLVATVTS